MNVKAITLNSTSLLVSWNAGYNRSIRPSLRKYRVIYTSTGSVFPNTTRNVTTRADSFNVVLTNLYKNTKYDIRMTAINVIDGVPSSPVSAKTDADSKFGSLDLSN